MLKREGVFYAKISFQEYTLSIRSLYFAKQNLHTSDQLNLDYMLSIKLNSRQVLDLSRSSLMEDESDPKKLTSVIEDQRRTIHRLSLKVQKLQKKIKEGFQRTSIKSLNNQTLLQDHQLEILKIQINKSQQLQQVLNEIGDKIMLVMKELVASRQCLQKSVNEAFLTINSPKKQNTIINSIENVNSEQFEDFNYQVYSKYLNQIQTEMLCWKSTVLDLKKENQQLKTQNRQVQEWKVICERARDQLKDMSYGLEQERRQRIKLKTLLQRSQYQKNALLMKIDRMANNDKELLQRSRQQLIQQSKSLVFKISSLQRQKLEITKESQRQSLSWSKRYQQLLTTVKSGKSPKK